MTVKHRQTTKCEHCGQFTDHDSPFGRWLRKQPELDSKIEGVVALDIDWIVHRYRASKDRCGQREIEHLMIVETKSFGARIQHAQRDTLNILGELLNNSRKNNYVRARGVVSKVYSAAKKKEIRVRAWGVHLLVFQRTCPRDGTMTWDRESIDEKTLVGLLRFDLNPYTLKPLGDRRHHTQKTLDDGWQTTLFPVPQGL